MSGGFYDRSSDEQVARLAELAASALPEFGLASDAPLELLAERENTVFAAGSGADRLVVRVHRAGYHSDGELRSHAIWAEALAADGVVATAPVVRTAAGEVVTHVRHPAVPEERQVTALGWVEGTILAESGETELEQYEQVGALMAALHEHATRWQPPAVFEALAWDADGFLGEQATWGRFWESPLLDDEGRALLARFRAHAGEQLDAFGQAPDRFGLVHGDFLPENLLLGPDGTFTLLDFDDCGRGWFLFDIATALVMATLTHDPDACNAAFVRGYRSVRPLSDEHLELLPLFLVLRGATYVGWMDTRAHTQFAKDMGPIVAAAAVDAAHELFDG